MPRLGVPWLSARNTTYPFEARCCSQQDHRLRQRARLAEDAADVVLRRLLRDAEALRDARHVGTFEECRERVRWFPAMVANHVIDLVNRYPPDELPETLTGYIRDREGYDYSQHAVVGSANAEFVADDIVDRFAIIGPPEEHVRRLTELAEAGVDQFNLYLMSGDEELQLEADGSTIIPALEAALGEA